MQVLTAAVAALAPAQRGQVGRWPMAWSGSEGFSSPAEELILSMQSPHAQVRVRQASWQQQSSRLSGLENDTAASGAALYMERQELNRGQYHSKSCLS